MERRLAAILAADVAGSSELKGADKAGTRIEARLWIGTPPRRPLTKCRLP